MYLAPLWCAKEEDGGEKWRKEGWNGWKGQNSTTNQQIKEQELEDTNEETQCHISVSNG